MRTERGWSIGAHRVAVVSDAAMVTATVDGASRPALRFGSRILGAWPFAVGERTAEVRRVRTLDTARTELWIDGVRVPWSVEPIPLRAPKSGALCKLHPKGAPSKAAPPAEIACGICGAPICPSCSAVDGVRCHGCFDAAVAKLVKDDRAKRVLGIGASIALIAFLAFVGWVTGSRRITSMAMATSVFLVVLVIRGLVNEKRGR